MLYRNDGKGYFNDVTIRAGLGVETGVDLRALIEVSRWLEGVLGRELPGQVNFLSYIATPPFPSYVSGHSSTSGAAATVLAAFFPAKAAQLSAMAEEAAVSRRYGGIHFRSDNEAGLVLGRRVGERAVRTYGLRR